MGTWELLLVGVGLAMDAFAVSVCQGLAMEKATWKKALIIGLYFGIFQAAMPLIGYAVGSQFADAIKAFDHWIAFFLLAFIGLRMAVGSIKEMRKPKEEACKPQEVSLSPKKMLPLAVATSIDALAVGISFAFMNVAIAPAVTYIGIITLVLSMAGVAIGSLFGAKFKTKAELFGGIMLVLIGAKVLLEHLGLINI